MAVRVVNIVSRSAAVVPARFAAAEARARAERQGVHHLLVLDGELLLGVLCRCDLDLAFDGDLVTHCMRVPIVARVTDTSESTAAVMLACGVGCMPIVNEFGSVRGVVTRADLRRVGALPGERGIDSCAACGANHCQLSAKFPDTPVFCSDCLERVREKDPREMYYTLGGGD